MAKKDQPDLSIEGAIAGIIYKQIHGWIQGLNEDAQALISRHDMRELNAAIKYAAINIVEQEERQ